MSKVAIAILNWNGLGFLKEFLPTVLEHSSVPGHQVEIFVADNGSTDSSVEWIRSSGLPVGTILLDKNYGFAQGYNLALENITADYYLLLNSDVKVEAGWLQPMVDFMESTPSVAACMPKVVTFHNPDLFEFAGAAGGYIDYLGYPFCRGRILNHLEKDTAQYNKPTSVFWAAGASLMVRSNIYWEAGGLDPDFFAHMEEIDLCWRIKRMGHSVWCIPSSRILHVGGGSLPSSNPHKSFLNHRNNLLMLVKNLPALRVAVIIPLRIMLDLASACVYLLSGKTSFAGSVINAHFQFLAMLPATLRRRRAFSLKYGFKVDGGIYPKSIILQYFLLKRKHFSQLPGVKGLQNSIGIGTG